CMQDIEYPNSF
nr:immunoglobulin light chain junction region [Macaca mulatta]